MLRNEQLTGAERIAALMQSLVDAAETKRGRWGCLLCNAAVDQAPFDKPTEDLIVASMGRLKDAISFAVKETRAAGQAELIWMSYFGGRAATGPDLALTGTLSDSC